MSAEPSSDPSVDLPAIIEALAQASTALTEMPLGRREFPSRTALADLVEDLRALLFPGYFGPSELKGETLRYHLGARMDRVLHGLRVQIQRGLMAADPTCEGCETRALAIPPPPAPTRCSSATQACWPSPASAWPTSCSTWACPCCPA